MNRDVTSRRLGTERAANPFPSASAAGAGPLGSTASHVRRIPRTAWLGGGVLALALGLGLGWDWLAAAGVLPLLLAALPCAAMCALGLCMHGRGHGSGARGGGTPPVKNLPSRELQRPAPPDGH